MKVPSGRFITQGISGHRDRVYALITASYVATLDYRLHVVWGVRYLGDSDDIISDHSSESPIVR